MALVGIPAIEAIEAASGAVLSVASGAYLAAGGEKDKTHWSSFYKGLDISGVRRRPMPLQSRTYQQAHRRIIPYHMAPYRTPSISYHFGASRRYKTRRRRRGRYSASAGKHTFRKQSVGRALVERPIHRTRLLQVTRTWEPTSLTWSTANSTDGGFGISFKLSDLGSYTDFTAMFQYYKMLRCVVTFVVLQDSYPALTAAATQTSRSNGNDGNTGSAYDPVAEVPVVMVAADNGSAAGFSSKADAFAHDGTITHPFVQGKPLSVGISPHVRRVAGTAGTEVEVHKPQKLWVSTNDSAESHYGLRGYYQGLTSGIKIRIFCKTRVAFKDLKT